ncbi:MAG: PKD domain-containing protein, partial [Gammaproteobacteria bacterium]|nr:PKD domain-containing protein [Gammaproteobacteria bacterium]
DWDFGDGGTGTGVSPSYAYGAEGSFTVTLTVTDNDGLSNSATTTATISAQPQPPVADPNGPYGAQVGESITFDGSGSSDPDGSIVSYDWDFGDGGTGTGVSPSYAYGAEGSFTVTLTVTDNDGLSNSASTTATISAQPQPPVADPNGPYSGQVGDNIAFDGSGSSDPDGSIVTYDWDFGDGGTGAGVAPMHTYSVDGVFTVTLTVTDNDGLSSSNTTSATITPAVGNIPPTADANGPYNGTERRPVQFSSAGSMDSDGTIVAYLWDFGDGSTSTDANPTHDYLAAATYDVTLTVTDDAGATGSDSTTATIEAMQVNMPPVADPNGPYSGFIGDTITFDGSGSFDPDGTIMRYDWDFGDGGMALDGGAMPTHTYAAAGTYTVTLTVIDDMGETGETGSALTTATIEDRPPGGGEGCTPGYWKQDHHFDSWAAPYTPDTSFGSVFDDAFPGMTLEAVASQGGGGLKALGRQTVAALLNAASPDVSYDLTANEVITAFNDVYPGSKRDYNQLMGALGSFNGQGCPLN